MEIDENNEYAQDTHKTIITIKIVLGCGAFLWLIATVAIVRNLFF